MKFQLCLCACLLVACSSESDPVDTGPDSGVVDLGSTDTGSVQADSGFGEADAGSTDADAGSTDAATGNFVLTVQITGSGIGRIQDPANSVDCGSAEAPCTYNLAVGTLLTLTPTAGPNSAFRRWDDTICNTLGQDVCQFSVDADVPVEVSAAFSD